MIQTKLQKLTFKVDFTTFLQEAHSGPVSLPWDTIANYMGMAAILNFES